MIDDHPDDGSYRAAVDAVRRRCVAALYGPPSDEVIADLLDLSHTRSVRSVGDGWWSTPRSGAAPDP